MDVEPVLGFMKAILGFTRMSVRGINKVKRELGFVLMALNIRKVVDKRTNYNQNNNKIKCTCLLIIIYFKLLLYSFTLSVIFAWSGSKYQTPSDSIKFSPSIDILSIDCTASL